MLLDSEFILCKDKDLKQISSFQVLPICLSWHNNTTSNSVAPCHKRT